ncbi:phage virion morphogenesis protein [Leeia aquatica]|uniref:Phage virion morphogenesis protein n=1 Tax=Leeia aquatica TaxID=2725557 RepID=A0A847SC97_9NEIS|nr:phage virion morphogenesis protein [Leeia aquatica]NLR73572.1 phage virion morphogenesis protein [Leeia aquatica]
MSMLSLTIDDAQLQAALLRLEQAAIDLRPAMRQIAQALLLETERNFEEEGRPRWAPLADATVRARLGGKKAYKKSGALRASAQRQLAGMRILQHTGQLASSITTNYDSTQAVIGSNKVYAAIHQFGGKAGRGRSVDIPARPFLPVTANGELQPEAREAVLDCVLRHLRTAAGV